MTRRTIASAGILLLTLASPPAYARRSATPETAEPPADKAASKTSIARLVYMAVGFDNWIMTFVSGRVKDDIVSSQCPADDGSACTAISGMQYSGKLIFGDSTMTFEHLVASYQGERLGLHGTVAKGGFDVEITRNDRTVLFRLAPTSSAVWLGKQKYSVEHESGGARVENLLVVQNLGECDKIIAKNGEGSETLCGSKRYALPFPAAPAEAYAMQPGRWFMQRTVDEMDGSTNVMAGVAGARPFKNDADEEEVPKLTVQCEGGQTTVAVVSAMLLAAPSFRYRFDDEPLITAVSSKKDLARAVSLKNSRVFAQSLLKHKTLKVELNLDEGGKQITEFDLTQAPVPIAAVGRACRWPAAK